MQTRAMLKQRTIGRNNVEPQETPPLKQEKPSSICSRLINTTISCFKSFSIGVASAAAQTPISTAIAFIARKIGFIPELKDRVSLLKEGIENLARMGIKLDSEAIANAACPLEEYITQFNRAYPMPPSLRPTVLGTKIALLVDSGFEAPIREELVFRGLFQDVILKRIPKYIVSKIAPGMETALDSTIAKTARIIITALLFSNAHRANFGISPESYVSSQLVASLAHGIGLGILQETNAGLLGAIGAHMATNVWALLPQLLQC